MSGAPAAPAEPMVRRLSPVRCGRCNWPVTSMNKSVPGAEDGGLCTRCTRDDRGKSITIYTFYAIVPAETSGASDAPAEPMVRRLSPVRCGRCNWPVTNMNKSVPGSEAGGLCTRCTRDDRDDRDKSIAIYTFYAIVPAGVST